MSFLDTRGMRTRRGLAFKLLFSTLSIVIIGSSVLALLVEHYLRVEIEVRAHSEATREIDHVMANLEIADSLSAQAVRTAMIRLRSEARQYGAPHLVGPQRLNGTLVPKLILGNAPQSADFSIVDAIKDQTGATATIFVKSENGFFRVATNVLTDNGSRAVGTVLDEHGPAHAALEKGEPFYGVTDILGHPYMTGYEPMLDRRGVVVGAWYVGFPLKALADLDKHVSATRILDNGFVAVAEVDGSIVFRSSHVSEQSIHDWLARPTSANLVSKKFNKWNYSIIAAYPPTDISRRLHALQLLMVVSCASMCVTLSAGIYFTIRKAALLPITNLLARVHDLTPGCSEAIARSTIGNKAAIRDEVELLTIGFDEMAATIKARDVQLMNHSKVLEQEVFRRTAQLAQAHNEMKLFLECIPSILIGLDRSGRVTVWNQAAANTFGIKAEEACGSHLAKCGIQWLRVDIDKLISTWLVAGSMVRCDNIAYERDGRNHFLGLSIRPMFSKDNEKMGYIVTGADVTERKTLEGQLMQAHKLEAVGQLAAGIAHEINTPTQFVANNVTFLKDSFEPVMEMLALWTSMRAQMESGSVSTELLERFDQVVQRADLPYVGAEIPKAIEQSLDGLQRIANIVKAMKEFSHPGSSEKVAIDINRAIQTTITVARNEWKYVADVNTEFDDALPLVPCLAGEFQQVILNLIVNAAQAIAGVGGDGPPKKGTITISTRRKENSVEIAIRDTGPGIPQQIQARIFEPFFTTKPVGKGTGQGLSLAHSTIVKRHDGQIWFETEVGKGTTFFLRLPLRIASTASAGG